MDFFIVVLTSILSRIVVCDGVLQLRTSERTEAVNVCGEALTYQWTAETGITKTSCQEVYDARKLSENNESTSSGSKSNNMRCKSAGGSSRNIIAGSSLIMSKKVIKCECSTKSSQKSNKIADESAEEPFLIVGAGPRKGYCEVVEAADRDVLGHRQYRPIKYYGYPNKK